VDHEGELQTKQQLQHNKKVFFVVCLIIIANKN